MQLEAALKLVLFAGLASALGAVAARQARQLGLPALVVPAVGSVALTLATRFAR